MMTLSRPAICVVTRVRGSAGSPERERLLERLAAAAAGGVTMIQIRERLLRDRDLVAFTRAVVGRVASSAVRVVVNDRLDVALAADAHGVHLKSDGPSAADVRPLAPASFIIGRSIHTAEEAAALSREGGYDYLLFGTVFRSDSKPEGHPEAGVGALARACAAASVPVLAIGGIDIASAREVARAGAAGVAAISLFAAAADVHATVTGLRNALLSEEEDI